MGIGEAMIGTARLARAAQASVQPRKKERKKSGCDSPAKFGCCRVTIGKAACCRELLARAFSKKDAVRFARDWMVERALPHIPIVFCVILLACSWLLCSYTCDFDSQAISAR